MRPSRTLAHGRLLQRAVPEVEIVVLERRRLVRAAKSRVRLDFSPLAHRSWVVPENSNLTLLWWTLRGLRPERFADRLVGLDVRTADEIEAVRDRGENAVEGFLDRLRLTRQIQDERAAADHADLPREDRGWHVLETHLPHLFAESREELVRHRKRGFRRDG